MTGSRAPATDSAVEGPYLRVEPLRSELSRGSAAAPGVRTRLERGARVASHVLAGHPALIACTALYVAARVIVGTLTGAPELSLRHDPLLGTATVAVIVCWSLVLFLVHLVRVTFVDRSTGGILDRCTWTEFHRRYTSPSRLFDTALVLLLYLLASDTFVAFKGAISNGLEFRYDAIFAAADRSIHGGSDPWLLLHPLLDSPAVTRALAINYTYPFFLGMGGLVVWLAWTRRTELRERILLTMLLMWALLGTVLAALFPAAGPAFHQQVTGSPDFLPLLDYLEAVHRTSGLSSVATQEALWLARAEGTALHGGISAMPSMHVAMATLFALVGWQVDRKLGILAAAFALAILAGSVHLGWHYAIDGYVSAPLTAVIWWAVGRWLPSCAVGSGAGTITVPIRR